MNNEQSKFNISEIIIIIIIIICFIIYLIKKFIIPYIKRKKLECKDGKCDKLCDCNEDCACNICNCDYCTCEDYCDCEEECICDYGEECIEKDECWVCEGDNFTCKDYNGIINGTSVLDEYNVCDGYYNFVWLLR